MKEEEVEGFKSYVITLAYSTEEPFPFKFGHFFAFQKPVDEFSALFFSLSPFKSFMVGELWQSFVGSTLFGGGDLSLILGIDRSFPIGIFTRH